MIKGLIKRYNWHTHPGINLFFFIFFVFLIRIFLRGQLLELDEAEQVILAQHLSPGYPNQPPLYSWLQYGVFQLLGVHLYSLALLKYTLLLGALYCFHQLCRLHCPNEQLAWCATLAWAFIPAISLDLIKDNTHSILALFAACLTWYWFIVPSTLTKAIWYLIFGGIIGIGLLSKLNYMLFLIALLISGISLKNYRNKLFNPWILLTLSSAILIASPYFLWLVYNGHQSFHTLNKLLPPDKPWWNGSLALLKATLFFASPVLIITALFFPFNRHFKKLTAPNALLVRYHLICLPLLITLGLLTGIRDFQTRWLIPILFLCPILYFSQVKWSEALKLKTRRFLILCLLTQFIILVCLIGRSFLRSGSLSMNQIEISHINKHPHGLPQNKHRILFINRINQQGYPPH